MNHQGFLGSLSKETRKNLTQRLDWPGLVRLAFHGGLILAFGLAIYLGLPFWQLLLIPQGIAIVFCLHSCMKPRIRRRLEPIGWMAWRRG